MQGRLDRVTAALSKPSHGASLVRRQAGRAARRLAGSLGVLAYHRVAAPLHDPWALAVTPEHFDQQLAVLRDVGRVDALDDALAATWRDRCRRRTPRFAVTFDDGYADNLLTAVALLERHDAPATVFIATGMLDEPAFWWDVLSELTFGTGITADELLASARRLGLVAGVEALSGDLAAAHGLVYQALVEQPPAIINQRIAELSAEMGLAVPQPSGRPATTDELLRLASHPLITIGIHTVNHRRLTLLSHDLVRAELTEGARRLDELLGRRSRALAYPYGAMSPMVTEIARSVGITHAVTTDARWVGLREDPLLIPRLHAHDLGRDSFHDWITSA
jgi:peptidoglycan/xylan/chitin deacetylase (PgdA/CDA1 family)